MYRIRAKSERRGDDVVWRFVLVPGDGGVPHPLNHGAPVSGSAEVARVVAGLIRRGLDRAGVDVDDHVDVDDEEPPTDPAGALIDLAAEIVQAVQEVAARSGLGDVTKGRAALAVTRVLLADMARDPEPAIQSMARTAMLTIDAGLFGGPRFLGFDSSKVVEA